MLVWNNEVETIRDMVNNKIPIKQIAAKYGVSYPRMYQILNKFGIHPPKRKRGNFLVDRGYKVYWLNTMLVAKKVPKELRRKLLDIIELPDVCPALGVPLNYAGTGQEGWSRKDDSASIDRIDSSLGYVEGNMQIISWKANRIKSNATEEEVFMVGEFLMKNKRP